MQDGVKVSHLVPKELHADGLLPFSTGHLLRLLHRGLVRSQTHSASFVEFANGRDAFCEHRNRRIKT